MPQMHSDPKPKVARHELPCGLNPQNVRNPNGGCGLEDGAPVPTLSRLISICDSSPSVALPLSWQRWAECPNRDISRCRFAPLHLRVFAINPFACVQNSGHWPPPLTMRSGIFVATCP